MRMPADRVLVLDGYHGLTILMAIVFHYMTRWTFPQDVDNHLPAVSVFSVVPAFQMAGTALRCFS